MISSCYVALYGQARILCVVARDHMLPPVLARISPRLGTPVAAATVMGLATGAAARAIDSRDDFARHRSVFASLCSQQVSCWRSNCMDEQNHSAYSGSHNDIIDADNEPAQILLLPVSTWCTVYIACSGHRAADGLRGAVRHDQLPGAHDLLAHGAWCAAHLLLQVSFALTLATAPSRSLRQPPHHPVQSFIFVGGYA